jgi:hypothetical protein
MSGPVAAHASDFRIVFAGQSLNLNPPGDTYPEQVMEGRGVPWNLLALNGQPWDSLRVIDLAPGRLDRWGSKAATSVLIQCGGTTDYNTAMTGAQCYADEVTYAIEARAAGFDIIVGSTTNPATIITGGEETERLAGNALVLADASNAFDYVIDFAGDPRLDDATDTAVYFDGIHPTALGASYMAELAAVPLDAILGV